MILDKKAVLPNTMRKYSGSIVCNAVPIVYMSEPLKSPLTANMLHVRIYQWFKSKPIRRAWRALTTKKVA